MGIAKRALQLLKPLSTYQVTVFDHWRQQLETWAQQILSPGMTWPTPFIIGVDPDPSSSAVLRVGGGALLGGALTFTPDNTFDIGAAGASRPRTLYAGTSIVVGTDPGGSDSLRVGGAVSLTGAVSWYSAAVQRWSIGLSGGGGLQLRPVAGAVDTHVYFVDSGFTTRASLNVADGTLVLGTDPGGSDLLRVGGNVRARKELRADAATSLDPIFAWAVAGTDKWQAYVHPSVDNNLRLWDGTADRFLFKVGGELDVLVGPLIVGTDPGGSGTLRVGGPVTFKSAVWQTSDANARLFYSTATDTFYGMNTAGGGHHWRNAADADIMVLANGGTLWIGADPGSSELLRILNTTGTGAVRLAGDTSAAWPRASIIFQDTAAGTPRLYAFGVRSGALSWSDETAGVQRMQLLTTGALVLGSDPGGTELLRVGGGVRAVGERSYFGDTAFVGTGAKQLNVRSDRVHGGQITFEDANASPGATWEIGIGAGTAADEFNWYNQTAPALRMSLKASGALVLGVDPGSTDLLRVGGAVRVNGTVTATAFSGDGSALTNVAVKLLGQLQGLSTVSIGTEVSLGTVSVPAGKLSTNGQAVRITVAGRVVGGTATGTCRVKFGATYLDANTAMATSSHFTFVFLVTRTGATSQLSNGVEHTYAGTSYVGGGGPTAAPAETLSGAVTIDVRGFQSGPGTTTTLFVDSVQVEFLSA